MRKRTNMEPVPRSSINPCASIVHIPQEALRLRLLLLLRTLDLCRSSESLLSVLALLACNTSYQYHPPIS